MRHLRALPRSTDLQDQALAIAAAPGGDREAVYVDDALLETVTEALTAWGLRVREERAARSQDLVPESAAASCSWETTRPDAKAPTRLENELSPLWFPIRHSAPPGDSAPDWGWFGRAA